MSNATNNDSLTPASLALFLKLARDAGNWSGHTLVNGNVTVTKAEEGNLSDLKVKGLIKTDSERMNGRLLTWVHYTEAGEALATEHGIDLR